MILHIDTKDRSIVRVSLKKEGVVVKSLSQVNQLGSQVLLPLIEKLLKEEKLEYQDLTELEVEKGPGSFVGLRVGVSVANALGFSLSIPVNSKKIESDLVY